VKLTHIVILIYGILSIAAGIVGFFKTDTFITLTICVVSGGILIFASNLIGGANFKGVIIALITSFLLGLFFSLKYTKYGVMMPTGIMTIISMLALGFSVYALTNKDQYK